MEKLSPFCCVKRSLIRIWWVMGRSEMTSARVSLSVASLLCGVSMLMPVIASLGIPVGFSVASHAPPPLYPLHILQMVAPSWLWSLAFFVHGFGIIISMIAKWSYIPHCIATFLGAMIWVFVSGSFFISLANYSVDSLPMLSLSCVLTFTLLACWRFLRVVSDNVLEEK